MNFEEARREAEYVLRFDIGTMPHLGAGMYSDERDAHVFPIKISYPRLPNPDDPDDEIEFDDPRFIGEIVVPDDGDPTHTPADVLNERVHRIKREQPPVFSDKFRDEEKDVRGEEQDQSDEDADSDEQ